MRSPRALGYLLNLRPSRRLILAALIGIVLFFALPSDWEIGIRSGLAWILAVALFLVPTAAAIGDAAPVQLRARARRQDEPPWAISGLVFAAGLASLAAAGALLHKSGGETVLHLVGRVALVAGVVVSSWTLIHTVFAIHYIHRYYGDGPAPGTEDAGGLAFPGDNPTPDFWDFLYFSLVIGMTCQVSDVQITGHHLRRLAAIHGVLSFFFNTVILALTINLVVNAL